MVRGSSKSGTLGPYNVDKQSKQFWGPFWMYINTGEVDEAFSFE